LNSPDSLVEVGYVAKAHGVRGEVRVHLHNPASQTLYAAESVVVGGETRIVMSARTGSKGAVLLVLEGVTDRDVADALRGSTVSVERTQIPLEDGEVLASDLVGCTAVLEDGSVWGTVESIAPGPQTRLVVRSGDVIRQLPLVDELVRDIDLDARTIVVEPPEGLPEEPQ
jgi:16S rRNA processing protein RimM